MMSPLHNVVGLNIKESFVAAEVNFISEGMPSFAGLLVKTGAETPQKQENATL